MAETTVTRKGDVGQRLAQYAPAVDLATSCGVCAHYQADMCGCEIVAGTINPDYTCRFFQTADPQAEAADELAEVETMPEPGMAGMAMAKAELRVAKIDEAQRRVFGWANIAVDKAGVEVVDHHGDIIEAAALEEAAYGHVLDFRKSGVDHNGAAPVGDLIESMFFDQAKAAALGVPAGVLPEAGWFVGYEFRDTPEGRAAFKSVVDGHRPAFSIEGVAQVEEL